MASFHTAGEPRAFQILTALVATHGPGTSGLPRYFSERDADSRGPPPVFLNLEMLGSGRPVYQRAEGHVTSFQVHPEALSLVGAVAGEPEFSDVEGIRSPAQSDALAAHHYGFPAITVMSLPTGGEIPHYRGATDTPENIDAASLGRCYRLLRRIIGRLDEEAR